MEFPFFLAQSMRGHRYTLGELIHIELEAYSLTTTPELEERRRCRLGKVLSKPIYLVDPPTPRELVALRCFCPS